MAFSFCFFFIFFFFITTTFFLFIIFIFFFYYLAGADLGNNKVLNKTINRNVITIIEIDARREQMVKGTSRVCRL